MTSLEEARRKIQDTDAQMAALFQSRMEAVREIAAYKKERGLPVFDKDQEQKVLSRNAPLITDEEIREYYLLFMQDVMDISKKYQERLNGGKKEIPSL